MRRPSPPTAQAQPATAWAKPVAGAGTHRVPTVQGERPCRTGRGGWSSWTPRNWTPRSPSGSRRSAPPAPTWPGGFPGYLPKDKVAGIEDVGKIGAPNLEAVAALKPDLILTSKVRDGKQSSS
ncbi:Iron-siderophore ABC transporter substrate-binding protein OS=Streptomyces rimosus subsp. rimosus(strain ATCC / DSM 40260 / JCM 4667 / NRRL 2234) OX=1265868 GN=SRIM_024645 PE=3 SV=1 [Streptomyces rimosus subsp. rimosus]